jgi:hypothetical protein
MQSKSNQKVWLISGIILGAILILVIGFLIGRAFFTGDSTDSPDLGGNEPRNPPTTGSVAIQAFSLEPDRIPAGECTTLSWIVTNAEIVTLSRDGELIYNALMEDHYQDCLSQAGIFRYRLDASNSDGQFFNWSELQVIVE